MSSASLAVPRSSLAPASESVQATRNALTLGVTLVGGMALGTVVRLFLVRLLGPDAFGQLRFAENTAELLFIALTLGVDTVIRREAALSPERVRTYVWGLLVLRLGAGVLLLGGLAAGLAVWGQGKSVIAVFAVLGLAQLLIVLNNSYTALEHASGRVGWIARVSLQFKLLWAALAILVLLVLPSGLAFACVLLVVETLRFTALTVRSGRTIGIERRPDLRIAAAAALASLPFFINFLAYSLYARIGVWWLGATVGAREIGWYGAAATLAAVAMIGMPLVSWVLIPSSTRATRHDAASLGPLFGGALRMALLLAVPISLAAAGWAPFWLRVLFDDAYLPATGALRALAPTFTLAYVASIASINLIQQERIRTVAVVSAGGLLVSVLANALLIPWGAAHLGTGGGATGAACATLFTEVVVTAVLLRLSWSGAWGRALRRTASGLAAASLGAAVPALAFAGAPLLAALASTAAFASVLLLTRTVTAADAEFCRAVITKRKKHVESLA